MASLEERDWDKTPTPTKYQTAEARLWYEVLVRAVADYKYQVSYRSGVHKASKSTLAAIRDISNYFTSDDFKHVCSNLDIEPDVILKSLNKWEEGVK